MTFGLTLKIRSVWCREMTVEVVFRTTAEKHGPLYTTSLLLSFTAWTLTINSRIASMPLNRTTPASAFRVPAHTEQSRFRNALYRELEKADLLRSNRMIRTLFISEQSVALQAGKGQLQHYNHRTRQIRLINVWPEEQFGWAPKDLKYRFQWTFPIAFSPHDFGIVYACGNHVFRTNDEGHSWEKISPDLTRADESKLGLSGGLTVDSSGAEHYGTISIFVESPHEAGVFWTGSDDGLVHTSRDGGKTWQNITPPDLPEWGYIFCIEVSVHDPDTIYLSATRYKLNDYRPFLYKSIDGGKSWNSINGDYPQSEPYTEISRVIREDPVCPGLLFVGSETGIFMSVNDGKNWQKLQGNFPGGSSLRYEN